MPSQIQFKNIKDLPVKITDWIGSSSSIVLHTIFFIGIFALKFFGFNVNDILLILTTAVSLEAIYLSIFIQMTVNRNTQSLSEVEENIDEIQEDFDVLEKDIDEIQEDIDEIQEDGEQEIKTQAVIEDVSKKLQGLVSEIEALKSKLNH